MNILVTLNSRYLPALKVMLKSLFLQHPDERFSIYLLHSSIRDEELSGLRAYVEREGHRLDVITLAPDCFADAPVIKHYSKEMYYRLLAFRFLPDHLDKILYLDPDILVINSIRPLYDTDLTGYLYAAAFHDRISVKEINRLRLIPYEIDAYYNSGVLLMNLPEQRKKIREEDIFRFVERNKKRLVLPDQDVLNALYSKYIKTVDEVLYNYDPRYYLYYKMVSKGQHDMDFVIRNTAIIHFCGKKKPWHKNYAGRFHSLYKHYEKLALSSPAHAAAEPVPSR